MILKRDFCLKCNAWRGELGLEPTIELYISHLLQIFDELKRVLKKTGCVFVNIGDSYFSSQNSNRNSATGTLGGKTRGGGEYKTQKRLDSIPAKSLCGIPERFVLGMQDRGWIRRNSIIWYKKNPMPESVKDRFTKDFEYLFFFVKSKKYWFEQQFEPAEMWGTRDRSNMRGGTDDPMLKHHGLENDTSLLGRNKRCVWEINTEPYPEAHFATFPEKLCETPILAGCPSQICVKCGKAREKVYESNNDKRTRKVGEGQDTEIGTQGRAGEPELIDKGYTDCGCNAGFELGVILDPFCGSGTVMAVAKRLNRKSIGVELNENYCKLVIKRLQSIPMSLNLQFIGVEIDQS